jgi:hypothetical protein
MATKKADDAKEELLNSGAGFPDKELAEQLPEGDEVEKAYKDAMTADTVAEEVHAKVKAVEASPDASDTPSGGALKAVEDIADPVEQGEAYAREKAARRHGYVPAEDK